MYIPTNVSEQDVIAVMNAIRNDIGADFKSATPIATESTDTLNAIGNVVMSATGFQNGFLNALINRVALSYVTSKLYRNPYAFLKRGILELADNIQEIFIDIAKPHKYDIEKSETEVWKREKPNVETAFHTLNYKVFYKNTIEEHELRRAFINWGGFYDFINRIVEAMYTAANYDEFNIIKYLIGRRIIDGKMYPSNIPTASKTTAGDIVTAVKAISNKITFMTKTYNSAGVHTFTLKENQYVFVNSDFEAIMGVNVLATAFNMSEAEFMGRRILIDDFGNIDMSRFESMEFLDGNITPFTDAQLTALSNVPIVVVDKDFFMLYDVAEPYTRIYNPQGLYWNYWLHMWKVVSCSPFANAIVFVPETPSVNSITVSPTQAYVAPNKTVTFTATVNTAGFAPQDVEWSVSDETATITGGGMVTLGANPSYPITVTARSTYNNNVTGTATIYNNETVNLTVKSYTGASRLVAIVETVDANTAAKIGTNKNAIIVDATNGTKANVVITSITPSGSADAYLQLKAAPSFTPAAGDYLIINF